MIMIMITIAFGSLRKDVEDGNLKVDVDVGSSVNWFCLCVYMWMIPLPCPHPATLD
jgi:hypothetical protein